jgi:hypothetical protein
MTGRTPPYDETSDDSLMPEASKILTPLKLYRRLT